MRLFSNTKRRHLAEGLLAASILLGHPMPARAAEQAGKWQVNWEEQNCTLSRRTTSAKPAILALRAIAGTERPTLVVMNSAWPTTSPGSKRTIELQLFPSGTKTQVLGATVELKDIKGQAFMVSDVGPDFMAHLAASRQLRVMVGGKDFLLMTLSGADKALEALDQCHDDLLRKWGIDPDELVKLQAIPRPRDVIFRSTDYPRSALKEGSTGVVVIASTIDTSGNATQCRVVASSGDESLDRATCSAELARGKYTPAIGPDGLPKSVTVAKSVAWTIASW